MSATNNSDVDNDADAADLSPSQRINEIWQHYNEELRELNGGPGTQMAIEMIQEMSAVQAEVEAADPNGTLGMQVEGYINQLADRKSYLGRKNLKSVWEDAVEAAKAEQSVEDGVPTQFSQLIRKTVQEPVTKTITRDADSSEATYEFRFDDGQDTSFTVPRGTVFSQQKFWEAYTSESGQYPTLDDDIEKEGWMNFIGGVLEEVEEVKYEDGPQTAAFHSLENKVKTATAYSTLEDAVDHAGVYVDDEPPDHTEVWVLREDIAQIVAATDITDRRLQGEIASRDAHADAVRNDAYDETGEGGSDAVSWSTTVHGLWQTVWQLNADEFESPDDYIEDPENQQEREDAAIDEAREKSGSDTVGDSDEDDEETGMTGEFGPSNEDTDDGEDEGGNDEQGDER